MTDDIATAWRLPSGDAILFVGAEGCAELGNQAWLRDPTEDEVEAYRAFMSLDLLPQSSIDWEELFVDRNNRPYWLKVVTPDAPPDIWRRALVNHRVVRLLP